MTPITHSTKYLLFITFVITSLCSQAQIVNPAIPITHTVTVNRIVSESTNGDVARSFGNSAQEADIIEKVNNIWAQVGIEIIFLPETSFIDDFTYDNNGSEEAEETRPQSDLAQIINLANLPDTPVESVPGFAPSILTANTAAGLAFVDRPGTTVFVGANLLNFAGGRTAIAGVVAHEIGHNLGLFHVENGIANLMSPGGSTDQLTSVQRTTTFTNNGGIDGFDLLVESIPTLTNYEQFVIDFNIQGGPNDDNDNDGLSNLVEFSIGTNPTNVSNNLPQVTQVNPSEFSWSIPKNADAVEDNINYEIQFSANLLSFDPAGTNSNSSISVDNDTVITANSFTPNKGFFRLSVQQQAEALQVQFAAQLAKEDLAADQFAKPEIRCACGQEH